MLENVLKILRIATRKSPLALWQTNEVARRLEAAHPSLKTELVSMVTKGDKLLDSPLAKIGGKGLFVKELEQGMLNNESDIAVHSMKDVPVEQPDGLHLSVVLKREDPRDAFVSNDYQRLDDLPSGARVGTSSLRRKCQIKARHPHLTILDLRGNVNTRLAKLDDGQYDAIILAAAGLIRLEMQLRIRDYIEPEVILPAVGQGVIGVECRTGDTEVEGLLTVLNDAETACRIKAERAMNNRLNGGCQVPIASYSEIDGDNIWLRGLVGEPDGSIILQAECRGPVAEAAEIGIKVAEDLLSQGAFDILNRVGLMSDGEGESTT